MPFPTINMFFHIQPSFQVMCPSCGELLLMHVIHWMRAIACHCKNLRHGSPTCKNKQRFVQNVTGCSFCVCVLSLSSCVPRKKFRLIVVTLQTLIIMSALK